MPVTRKMHLVAYLKTGPTASYASAWRHPSAPLHDIWEPSATSTWRGCSKHARFDAGFFADGLGLPDFYKNSFADYRRARRPAQPARPDDGAAADGARDRHLGLGNTISTTFNQPYQIARTWARSTC